MYVCVCFACTVRSSNLLPLIYNTANFPGGKSAKQVSSKKFISLCGKLSGKMQCIKVGGFDQLFRNPPSKPSNVQVDEGLLETNFDLKAVTTSSFEMKFLDCPQPYPKVSK